MENYLHRLQQQLLLESLQHHWKDRTDYFAGANMFVYFSLQQADQIRRGDLTAYRGPDFFVVLNTSFHPPRSKWVVWAEGGKLPDVVVELLSPSTAQVDRGEKMRLYEQVWHTPEYFLYDFDKRQLEGYELANGAYRPKEANEQGWLWSEHLGLWLGSWAGVYAGYDLVWLRFYTPEGELVLTRTEAEARRAEEEARRAEEERQRAEAERHAREQAERLAEAERRAREQAETELQKLRERLRQLGIQLDE